MKNLGHTDKYGDGEIHSGVHRVAHTTKNIRRFIVNDIRSKSYKCFMHTVVCVTVVQRVGSSNANYGQ